MISVEGDVYLNSFGGTQGWIELRLIVDNILVTENGPEILSQFTRDLIVL